MSKSYRVTSAGVNPVEDRAHRMKMYFLAMSLRVLCITSLFWLRGWWVLLAAFGAVVLPWFAVMIGNAVSHGGEGELELPEPLALESGHTPENEPGEAEPLTLVVDAPATATADAPPSPGGPAERPEPTERVEEKL